MLPGRRQQCSLERRTGNSHGNVHPLHGFPLYLSHQTAPGFSNTLASIHGICSLAARHPGSSVVLLGAGMKPAATTARQTNADLGRRLIPSGDGQAWKQEGVAGNPLPPISKQAMATRHSPTHPYPPRRNLGTLGTDGMPVSPPGPASPWILDDLRRPQLTPPTFPLYRRGDGWDNDPDITPSKELGPKCRVCLRTIGRRSPPSPLCRNGVGSRRGS